MPRLLCIAVLAALAAAAAANADDRTEYQRRVATRDVNLFQELDRDRDGSVSREEASGNLNFVPRFPDMDVNGDNVVTREELTRYIELRLGSDAARVANAAVSPEAATAKQ